MQESKWLFIHSFEDYLSPLGLDAAVVTTGHGKYERWGKGGKYWYTSWDSVYNTKQYKWLVFGDWSGEQPTEYLCVPPDGGKKLGKRVLAKVEQEANDTVKTIKQQEQRTTRRTALEKYKTYTDVTQPTPYLSRKKIEPIIDLDPGLKLKDGQVLVIPTRDIDGVLWGYQMIFPHGKKLFCRGQNMQGMTHTIEGDDSKPIYICEGYATGASIRMATGATVVVAFNSGNLKTVAPAIAAKYNNREIILCADNDQFKTNAGLKAAEIASSSAAGAPVVMPEFGEDDLSDQPTDYNDYHCLYGLEALRDDIAQQLTAKGDDDQPIRERIRFGQPDTDKPVPYQDIANQLMKEHKLLHKEGLFYIYQDNIWQQMDKTELCRMLAQLDSRKHHTQARASLMLYHIAIETNGDKVEFNQVKPWEIPVANGIFNLNSKELRPHRATDLIDRCIPWEYEVKGCPTWLRTLDKWFEIDPPKEREEKIKALQAFFGYLLMPHAKYKKALMLFGPSNTGKSVVQAIATHLVGANVTCSIPLEKMDDQRAIEPIVGAVLNNVNEPSSGALFSDGGFKRLVSSGDERVTIDPKHVTPYQYLPTAKHIIYTNTMPGINDTSMGTYNRLLILKFERVFKPEEMDSDLIDTLKSEITGILAWSMVGAMRLYEAKGEWPVVNSSETAILEHRMGQNQVAIFLKENCATNQVGGSSVTKLWTAFKANRSFGRIALPVFEAQLKAAGVEIEQGDATDTLSKVAKGITLKVAS